MAKFRYTGEASDGTKVSEVIEADDRYAVFEIARENGHTAAEVIELKGFSISRYVDLGRINMLLSRIKDDDLVMISRNLSAMLGAGLPLSRALSVSQRQSKNQKMSYTLEKVRESINQGNQFNEALAEFPNVFSDLYVSMVRAGEESGKLSDVLRTISEQIERTSELKKKIKGAMIYPAIVMIVMFIIGVLMMIYVVPTLSTTFESLDVELPTTTRILLGISDFLANHTLTAIFLMIASVVGFITLIRTKYGRIGYEWFLLHTPVINTLVKETNAARTTRTLSSLLSGGVDVVSAINITRDVIQNSFCRKVLEDAADRIEKGKLLSEAFIEREDLYPILVGEMISVGEETGQISKMLLQVAVFYENEVDRKTKDLSTIIEPVLMVVIGSGVGFFALAMIAPIYSISDSI